MIKKDLSVVGILVLMLFLFVCSIWVMRFVLPSELDDVSPEIICSARIIEKSDVLWVIPEFNGHTISENMDWCNYILSLNKTLGMHGSFHKYREFEGNISQEYLDEGIEIFFECFGFKPDMFKPPQLKISEKNIELIEKNGMDVKLRFNQVTRKVYHCNDEPEMLSNSLIELI